MKNPQSKKTAIFELEGEVRPKKNMYRITRDGRFYTPKEVSDWILDCGWQLSIKKVGYFDKPIEMEVMFYLKRDKDIDNILGGLFDCLQKNEVIKNDSLIKKIIASKCLIKQSEIVSKPKVCVKITEI